MFIVEGTLDVGKCGRMERITKSEADESSGGQAVISKFGAGMKISKRG
jgi:hypothetical protein